MYTRLHKNKTLAFYAGAVINTFIGLSYCASPLYQLLCTTTGIDGTPVRADATLWTILFPSNNNHGKLATTSPVQGAAPIKVRFSASVSERMPWKFKAENDELHVVPGESALAFFEAFNPTDKPIVGISTYSVVPAKAAQYFNKIQCFCFDEQLLEAKEQVDMPVFFYIDPDFAYDPWMKDVSEITLHYTFFKSKSQPNEYGLLK
jgi:cytochrome c oxidase assembly protein subunit 11